MWPFTAGLRTARRPGSVLMMSTPASRASVSSAWSRVEAGTVTVRSRAAAVPDSGAILNPGEGWVDLPSLIDRLVAELRDRGGEVATDVGRVEVEMARKQAVPVQHRAQEQPDCRK